MKRTLTIMLCLAMLLSLIVPCAMAQEPVTEIRVTALKQTSSAYDLGIAADNVRLAWELGGDVRGVYQSAYRLMIRDDKETVYDTDWVESSTQSGVRAQNLEPETVYYWTVNVKDQYGTESGFAPEASFETAPEAVSGNWIGTASLVRKEFTLEQPLSNVARARSYIGSSSPLEIHINGQKAGDLVLSPHVSVVDGENYYNTYDILPYLQNGDNAVGVMLSNGYTVGFCCAGMLKIWYKDGSTQTIATGSDWQMTSLSPITKYGWFNGENIDGRLMHGWDQVGYDVSDWTAAENTGNPVYDGVYHVGESAGMVYAEPVFSGDYTIETSLVITKNIAAVMFGKGSPNPAMWQLDAKNDTLRIHRPSGWGSGDIEVVSVGNIEENVPIDFKIEIQGTAVTTYVNGSKVNTTTIAAGAATGQIGVRTSSNENFNVDYFRVTQNGSVIFEDAFDTLDKSVWSISTMGKLVPAISGTTVIEEVEPVAIYADTSNVNTMKPYVLDGAMVFPTNCGTYYTRESFSGDYSIEVAVQSDNYFGLLFGNGNQPLMAQLAYYSGKTQVKMHQKNNWSGAGITTVEHPTKVNSQFVVLRVDVVGNDVTLSIDGEKVMTVPVAEGATSGVIGIRETAYENCKVDYLRVYQNGETVFSDDFDDIDTAKWTIPAQNNSPFDTTKPYCENGTLYLPTNCGTYYSKQTFSGDYTIEMEGCSDNVLAILFGNGSPNPAMWQFSGSSVNAHMPGSWGDIRRSSVSGLNAAEMNKYKLEIKGNDVTLTINDTIDGGTITLPAGATTGMLGFRETVNESAQLKYIRVIQDGNVIFEDDFETIDTEKWSFPAQTETKYVVDFGKNMAGYVKVSGKLNAGDQLSLAYSEMVDSLGNIFPNTTSHFPVCTYTFTGGEDTFEPYFFYTGFRYVEVSGVKDIDDLTFTACFTSDEVEQTGYFTSSNDRLNSIFAMYYQSQRSNMVGNYTDCPQREKAGWTGDASVTKQAASMMLSDYYTAEAYMKLMVQNVRPSGEPHCILPRTTGDTSTNFDIPWASAYFTYPYYTYLQTGDTYYIEMMYDKLVSIFAYYQSIAAADGVPERVAYGDWLGYDNQQGKLNRAALGATYAYYSGSLLAEMAEIIGRDHTQLDADLSALYTALQNRYNKGSYWSSNTQTGNGMALDFGLVPEAQREQITSQLVKNLTDYGSLRTGVLGTLSLYNALSEANEHKVLLDATVTGDKCSFGYMLDNGATTLWEYWDRAYEGFNSLGANGINTPAVWDSQNHCMMGGGLTTWLFEGLGGIRSTGAAYHNITFRPGLESELSYVNSSVDTMIGLAESDWTWENGVLDWTLTVPVNADAKIMIPVRDALVIQESGKNVFCKDGNGLTYVGMEDGAYVYQAGSGTYEFHVSTTVDAGDVDVTALTDAIAAATKELDSVLVSDLTAAEVEKGVQFVAKKDAQTMENAISTAKIAIGDVKTQEEVQAAVKTLNDALAVFRAAVQTGLLGRIQVLNADPTVPVSVEILVNGQLSTTALPADIAVLDGDVVTAKVTALNHVDYAVSSWTVDGKTVCETDELEYTVSGSETISVNFEWISGENLALGKKVIAERVSSSFDAANLTDGKLCHLSGGVWSSPGQGKGTTFAEVPVVIDLEEATTFNRLQLYPRKDAVDRPVECFPTAYQIYVSDDNANWTSIYTETDGAVSSGYEPVVIQLEESVTARYVKLGVTSVNCGDFYNTGYVQLTELAIFNAEQTTEDVMMLLRGEEWTYSNAEQVTYTVSARNMKNLANVRLDIEIPSELLCEPVAEGLNSWYVIAQTYRNGVLSVVLGSNEGVDGESDIAKIKAVPAGTAGTATVRVQKVLLSIYDGAGESYVSGNVTEAVVTTQVAHNRYDVNRDGVVDQLDLTRAQRYYGTFHEDADVNDDNVVDINDLILIMNNFDIPALEFTR